MTDTVGFIRKLPHDLIASFRATLEEVAESDLLVHVIDAAHPSWEDQQTVVEDVLAELGAGSIPRLQAFNQMDRLPAADAAALRTRVGNLFPNAIFVSAVSDGGLEPLRHALADALHAGRPLATVRLPADSGKLLADLYRDAEVRTVGSEGSAVVVRARLDRALVNRLRRAGAAVTVGDGDE